MKFLFRVAVLSVIAGAVITLLTRKPGEEIKALPAPTAPASEG